MNLIFCTVIGAIALLITGPLYLILKPLSVKLGLLFKSATTLLCAAICLPALKDNACAIIVFCAICVCSIADSILDCNFIAGMFCFLTGHILFIIAFSLMRLPSWTSAIIFVIAVSAVAAIIFTKHLRGKILIPGVFYGMVISAMLSVAVPLVFNGGYGLLTAIGAVLFFISDSIIAITLSRKNGIATDILILITYWGAQICIASSVLLTYHQ